MESNIFTIASTIGSIAFALSGFLIGARKGFDIIGTFIVAFLTANGGGVIRDLCINKTPAILVEQSPFWIAIGVVFLAWIFGFHRQSKLEQSRWFVFSDAIGLATFGITGALAGVEANLSVFGVVVLSFITATGGGIIRDCMVNEVPQLLSSQFYGSVAILQGVAIYHLDYFGISNAISLGIVLGAGLILRILAYWRGWRLPKIQL